MLVVFSSVLFAQDGGTAILPFSNGKSLSKQDIKFLDLVSQNTTRGATVVENATIGDATFKAGQTLTKEEAEIINKAIATYAKDNKGQVSKSKEGPSDKSRGCYYYCYYYYYDYSCDCYYYYYYCC